MKSLTYNYGGQSISNADIIAVNKILRSSFLTQGPSVDAFEAELCRITGAKFAVAVANGTAALHLAMLVTGISSGDEVITTPMTFAASANCVAYCGGKVIFADIDPTTGLIDPKEVEKKISNKTRAIVVVHYAGQSCEMLKIRDIAKKRKLIVIEDAAHAIGSEYRNSKVGSCVYSDMTTFSFHPVKTVTTGEGGAITTNNRKLYEKLRDCRTHGIVKDKQRFQNPNNLEIGSWYYEMQSLGYNYRISDIQTALGLSQLNRLDQFVKRRREIVLLYQEAFKDDSKISLIREQRNDLISYHIFPLLINFEEVHLSKVQIIDQLNKQGIYPQVHYIPVHLQPYYYDLGFRKGDFPNSEIFYERQLSIPLYPALTNHDVRKIISIIKQTIQS